MAAAKALSYFLLLHAFFVLVLLLNPTSVTALSSAGASIRRPSAATQKTTNGAFPDCGEIGSRSQCSRQRGCRWCRSDILDDLCFSKLEAWRLPSEVFTCD